MPSSETSNCRSRSIRSMISPTLRVLHRSRSMPDGLIRPSNNARVRSYSQQASVSFKFGIGAPWRTSARSLISSVSAGVRQSIARRSPVTLLRGGSHCFRRLSIVALAAAALGSPPRLEAQELTKVTIALPVLASVVMPLYYARDAGLFKKYGLDVDLLVFRGGPPANAALLSGDAQFLASDPYEFLKVADSGREIRVVTFVHSMTFDFIA